MYYQGFLEALLQGGGEVFFPNTSHPPQKNLQSLSIPPKHKILQETPNTLSE